MSSAPSTFAKLVTAARAEGSVTLASPSVQNQAAALKTFSAKYGVKVNTVHQPSSVVGSSLETQEQTGKVTTDLIQSSNYSQVKEFGQQGYLAKYTPQTSADYPASVALAPYAWPVANGVNSIAWNTKTTPPAVQKALESDPYQALLSPSLKGKIVLLDANQGGSGMAFFSNLVYNVKGYGWPYLTRLAAQDPAITNTVDTIASEVESGTYDVTNFGSMGSLGPAVVSGAPVRWVSPSPAPATVFQQAIVQGAPHPAAARLFMEWSLSHAGQEAITKASGLGSEMKGWVDNRPWVKQIPWYKAPSKLYLSWQTDARLTGDNLTSFLAKWSDVFHHSN